MYVSPFGIEHADINKADKKQPKASAGRLATAAAFSPIHGLVAGKKGRKLRAGGNELAGGFIGSAPGQIMTRSSNPKVKAAGSLVTTAGGIGGTIAGAQRAQRMGHFKTQKTAPPTL